MCLEDCGGNVTYELEQLSQNSAVFDAISYKWSVVSQQGEIVKEEGVTNPRMLIQSLGLETFPMICCFDINIMRVVFESPNGLINQAVQTAVQYGLTGFNIDWEPVGQTTTQEDAVNFSNFLTLFANELHSNGKQLSVDVANWTVMWNETLLNETTVDYLMDMDSYDPSIYQIGLDIPIDLQRYGSTRLGVSINTKYGYDNQQIQHLSKVLTHYPVEQVAIWAFPIPDNWWAMLEQLHSRRLIHYARYDAA